MAVTVGKVEVPVYARVGDQERELGTVELDLDAELDELDAADDVRGVAVCAQAQLQAMRDQLEADLPGGRALSLALTKLDEARLWLEQVR